MIFLAVTQLLIVWKRIDYIEDNYIYGVIVLKSRTICVVFIFAITVACSIPFHSGAADAEKVPTGNVLLNGHEIIFDPTPVLINDNLMVPYRQIFTSAACSLAASRVTIQERTVFQGTAQSGCQ